ncbi:peptidoglycan-binding protein [Dokdonella sp.]|uniref:peptidoglycan-binding domain-containing protein n=1 Tax=Dokdonella sp. TaxID=2291710 RepID=UPI003528814F
MDYFSRAATKETKFPGELKAGSRGINVRRLQEWLGLQGFPVVIDGDFQAATGMALNLYREHLGLPTSNTLDAESWSALVTPMQELLAIKALDGQMTTYTQAVLELALKHAERRPVEIGGQNCGPWVRAYMSGNQGANWPWCAGFVTSIASQAAEIMGVPCPLPRTFSCDVLAKDAQNSRRFRAERKFSEAELTDCHVFIARKTPNDWTHTGFAFAPSGKAFRTIEGNTNDDGSREGYEVVLRTRTADSKDFIDLGLIN